MDQISENEPIKVQDRVFHPATRTTFAQDMYVMSLVSNSKLEGLSEISGADLNKLAEKILLDAYASGNLFRILAGMVVEEGQKWTEKTSEENALFFSELTDPVDKEALHDAIAGVILSFFVNADGFLRTSPKSSSVTLQPREVSQELHPSLESDESSVELLTSGSGIE